MGSRNIYQLETSKLAPFTDIVRLIKYRKLSWAVYVASMEEGSLFQNF